MWLQPIGPNHNFLEGEYFLHFMLCVKDPSQPSNPRRVLYLYQVEDPYRFLAVQGTLDMIESAPGKVLPVIPQVSLYIRHTAEFRHHEEVSSDVPKDRSCSSFPSDLRYKSKSRKAQILA